MNEELTKMRGEAAALKAVAEGDLSNIKVPPIVIPTIPSGDGGKDKSKKKASGKKAYSNEALDAAYKQLEHKKRMDELSLESELRNNFV